MQGGLHSGWHRRSIVQVGWRFASLPCLDEDGESDALDEHSVRRE